MSLRKVVGLIILIAVVAVGAYAIGYNRGTASETSTPTQPAAVEPAATPATVPSSETSQPTQPEQPAKEDLYGTPRISKSSPNTVIYEHGDISWRTNIAEDIESNVLQMCGELKTPGDFVCQGTIIDEKYQQVITFGRVKDLRIGKLSFLNIQTGEEESSYWLDHTLIRNVVLIYEVPFDGGVKDYVAFAGGTSKSSIYSKIKEINPNHTGLIPLIEIQERLEDGTTRSIAYNPVAYVSGEAYKLKILRDNASVILEFKTTASGGTHRVPLERILSLPDEVPIFGD